MQDQDPLRIPIEGQLDLHTFAPRDIPSVVEEYLNEAHAAGLREVRLIHGRGKGMQRGIVQQSSNGIRWCWNFLTMRRRIWAQLLPS